MSFFCIRLRKTGKNADVFFARAGIEFFSVKGRVRVYFAGRENAWVVLRVVSLA